MQPETIGFIGLGLIGGSIAKTIHRIFPEIRQIAFDISEETLKEATVDGVIAEGCTELSDAFSACDIIFLCAPVLENDDYLKQLLPLLNDQMIVTDVGSVKNRIHEKIRSVPELEKHFIGGQPMCGTEYTGYAYSKDYLLENAYYVLTPSDNVPQEKVDRFYHFIQSIGALPLIMDPKAHDHAVGSVSHLPHVISASLVNLVRETDDEKETMRTIAAGGFKDITRISSSSPVMLENICIANREEILHLIDNYMAEVEKIRNQIAAADGEQIQSYFSEAKNYRDSINIKGKGSVHPIYQFFCDLIDEAGGIATIATILATNNISIKNIGIIHNREFEQGVIHLEFYQQDACDHAKELLEKFHYTIYER